MKPFPQQSVGGVASAISHIYHIGLMGFSLSCSSWHGPAFLDLVGPLEANAWLGGTAFWQCNHSIKFGGKVGWPELAD